MTSNIDQAVNTTPTEPVICAEPDAVPPSIEEMKAAIKANRNRIAFDLAIERKGRDETNRRIKRLVAELAEADRLVRALEPRKAKKS